MKSSFLKYALVSLLFILMLALVVFAMRPVYAKLVQKLDSLATSFLDSTFGKAGLEFSYESLSPSLFSSIELSGISIKNAETGRTIISVEKASLRYSLKKLLRGEYASAIKELVLEGGTVTFAKNSDMRLVEQVKALLEKPKLELSADGAEGGSSGEGGAAPGGSASLAEALALGFTISLRNIVFRYSDDAVTAELALKKASLVPDLAAKTNRIEFTSTLKAQLTSPNLPKFLKGKNGSLSLNLGGAGTCAADFGEASAQLDLTSIKLGEYSVAKFSFLLAAGREAVALRMVQNILPFNIRADYAVGTGDFYLRLDAEKLDFFDMLPVQAHSYSLRKLKGSRFDGVYELWANSKTRALSYSVNGGLFLPEKFVAGGVSAEYALSGTQSKANVKKLSLASAPLSGAFQGSCDFGSWRLEGIAAISSATLPNGEKLSAEVFCSPLEGGKGSKLSLPRLKLGKRSFRNVVLSAVPESGGAGFTLSADDAGGSILLDGSASWGAQKLVNANVVLKQVNLASVADAAAFFCKPKARASLEKAALSLAPYAATCDVFFSTDFKTYSINAPNVSVYNVKGKPQSLSFALSGGSNLFSLSELDLRLGKQRLTGSLQVDVGDEMKDVICSAMLEFNGIPYNFGATFVPKSYVSVLGDYGLEAYADLEGEPRLANISFAGLPLRISDMLLSASLQATADYVSAEDWSVHLALFQVEEMSNIIAAKPKFSLSGVATPQSVLLETISYSDSIATLSGAGSVSWLYQNRVLDSLSAHVQMLNPFSAEGIELELAASNPDQKTIDEAELKSDYYFTLGASAESISFAHFLARQYPTDTFTAYANVSGTLGDPLATLLVPTLTCTLSGSSLDFSGMLMLAEGRLSAEDILLSYKGQRIQNVMLDFAPRDFSGALSLDVFGEFFPGSEAGHSFKIPVVVSCSADDEPAAQSGAKKPLVPEAFTLKLAVAGITGDLINVGNTYTYTFKRKGKLLELSGGLKNEVKGSFNMESGDLALALASPSPLTGRAAGVVDVSGNNILVTLQNLRADLSALKGLLTYPQFAVDSGEVTGSGSISGLLSDPDFNGDLLVTNANVRVPQFLNDSIHADRIPVKVEQSTFRIEPMAVRVPRGYALFDMFAYFERWRFGELSLNIRTLENTTLNAKYALKFLDAEGAVSGEVALGITLGEVDFSGKLKVDNASVALYTIKQDEAETARKKKMDAKVDLQIELGEKVEACYPSRKNPMVWAQAVPRTMLYVTCDTSMDKFTFKGDIAFKGGEVFYIGRSFYLRNGRIVFDATQDLIDPRITFNAEIRERDADNKQVKIILSAENQLLSQLSPTLSASPAKSQEEVMMLLGQALIASSGGEDSALASMANVAIGLMDYGVQLGVFKQVEKRLRNVLKFDIFSFRLPLVQNSLLQLVNAGKSTKPLSLGNFLDNTTVYIGKYFGESIYADALLQLVYDERRVSPNDYRLFRGMRLQPEIGFEMESPFGNIRWSIAPDISNLNNFSNLWVPYNTLTISWKFQL